MMGVSGDVKDCVLVMPLVAVVPWPFVDIVFVSFQSVAGGRRKGTSHIFAISSLFLSIFD